MCGRECDRCAHTVLQTTVEWLFEMKSSAITWNHKKRTRDEYNSCASGKHAGAMRIDARLRSADRWMQSSMQPREGRIASVEASEA